MRLRPHFYRLLMSLVVALLPAVPAIFAQSTYGEIRGTVLDPSGAVVSGAAVTVKNKGTGESRTGSTDVTGSFSLVNLDAGTYEVAVESGGFRKVIIQNVILRAREVVRVDTTLQLAEAATEVMVTDARQVITTDVATIVDSKTINEIQNLPVNFRAGGTNSVFSAISLAPGVQPNNTGSEISLAGSLPFQATASLDGISMINVRSNGILTEMFPSADTIDEIKVSSVSNNAEFAQVGDVTTTSRGGTNNHHGSVYWYHQNGKLDARDTFSTRTSAPFKISNDFGFHMGGPVIKNKTFFFGAFEGLRFRAQRQINVTVPPDSYRSGNLSSVSAAIRDPLTNQAFAGNVIPANRISSVSQKVLERLYPRQTELGNSVSSSNYRVQKPEGNRNDQFDIRGDHVFNERHNLFARFSYKNVTRTSPASLTTVGDDRNEERSRTLVVAHNYVIRPSVVNEFRSGYSNRPRLVDFGPNGEPFDGPSLVKELGINGLRSDPPDVASVPQIDITGFLGTGKSRGFTQLSRNIQFTDNLTWTKGRHTLKFGADIRRLSLADNVSFFSGDDLGQYSFDGTYSGNAFADFLLGYPNITRVANTGPDIAGTTYHQGYFVQDDYRISSKLTLNYGVRYEYHPAFWDSTLQIANFDRNFPGGRVVVPNEESVRLTAPGFRASIGSTPIVTADQAGLPRTLRFTDKNNFAPRFGFAYRPFDNRTVIRGGYGIYSVTILGAVFYSLVGIHTSDTRTFNNSLVNGVPQYTFQNPFGTGLGAVAAVGNADFRRGNEFRAPDPYAQQWNLTIERDLGWNTGLRLTYTGSHSLKLFYSPDLNQVPVNTIGYAAARASRPFPNWAVVYSRDTGVSSKFHGTVAEVQKRFSQGLFFQSSWAWSKNLSNSGGSSSTSFAGENGNPPTDRFNLALDYGNISSTRRHRWLTTFSYELPSAQRGSSQSGAMKIANGILGGWQVSGILLFQSGSFATPTIAGRDPSGTNVSSRASNRPDYTGNSYGNKASDKTIGSYWDRSAFSIPNNNIGRFGYAGFGQLVGPGTSVVSAKLQKRFYLREQTYFQVEGSFGNLLNHPNYALPGTNVSAASFGVITATQSAEAAGSRTVQIGLRLTF